MVLEVKPGKSCDLQGGVKGEARGERQAHASGDVKTPIS